MKISGLIATISSDSFSESSALVAAWRDISDILAQRGNQLPESEAKHGIRILSVLRESIPEKIRLSVADSIAHHCRYVPLISFYASDTLAISERVLRFTILSEEDWIAFLPHFNSTARHVLATREDLPLSITRLLAVLGTSSMLLPAPASADEHECAQQNIASLPLTDECLIAEENLASQINADSEISVLPCPDREKDSNRINKLMCRIDSSNGQKKQKVLLSGIKNFLFETGSDGLIRWVEGVPRGVVIGMSLAEPVAAMQVGIDGAAARAFHRRENIINMHLHLGGSNGVSGDWRFSAFACFDSASGQFRGYRGSAYRPCLQDLAYDICEAMPDAMSEHALDDSQVDDSIRQFLHELRSPLNAISGFAQIIAEQMFGPVSQTYREIANTIIVNSVAFDTMINDLDIRTSVAQTEPEKETKSQT